MDSFASIFERACERKGGMRALEALLPEPLPATALAEIADADMLAEMTKCVFRAGFVWQIIENKWADQFRMAGSVLMYIERWLKAPVQTESGEVEFQRHDR